MIRRQTYASKTPAPKSVAIVVGVLAGVATAILASVIAVIPAIIIGGVAAGLTGRLYLWLSRRNVDDKA
jgi:hypothetical protein